MQIIQNIRDKGAAIVIGVIALSLIGFILMDAKQGTGRMFGSNSSAIGKINGEAITYDEFNTKVKQLEDQQYGGRVTGNMVYQIRQNVWDQMVGQKILRDEFEKLGLVFSSKEMSAIMFSDEAPQALKQAFTDKTTGQYDIAKVQQWWQQAKKYKGEQMVAVEQEIVEPMKFQTLLNKYTSLISASAYYPTWMKEKEAAENKTFATISYVSIPYNVISDSAVKVTDEDIMNYVKKYPKLYKQEAGRSISYVAFDANPSAADSAANVAALETLKPLFIADTNAKAFVGRNMSAIKYNDAYLSKAKLTMSQKDSIAALPVGGVFGPYLDGSNFVLAKMVGVKSMPDSIKCRHILIATTDRQTGAEILSDSIAKKRIDSIADAIKAGASFDALEAQFSTDQAAHKDKGVMTFDLATVQNKEQFAPEFGEFLLNEKGETKKTVKTNFGWHYIEILEKKNPTISYKIAYMAKEISPSDETVNAASAQATKLSGEARNSKALDAYVAKNGLKKIDGSALVKENDYQLGGLQEARQLIKWAFEAKEGEVSEPFSINDQFIVAVVTKVQPEGLPDAKLARPMVESLVRNIKKSEEIIKKIGATPTLEAAAAAYGKEIAVAGADSTLTFGAQIINGIGQEPKLIGASFNKENQTKVSAPIAGINGVYVIKVNSTGVKPADAPEVAAEQAKSRVQSIRQQVSYGWYEGLKKTADIKDDRSKFN
ncbi:SurA N-terminal domain-containing protein [Ferruginibacter lapsinanis]|uniref:SurA N-terminal domain-containing protein n=1 Tax=Ferruginibacter lapsinanis TaxID=563172 RepID=UPI001E5C9BB0|nr:SurA N-terminal domain-containing protein [Ferruginibacter lapsinanis]UEG50736.1 SurA N-terminal domain-containing protein [Ferruginibacter lapsinanis]